MNNKIARKVPTWVLPTSLALNVLLVLYVVGSYIITPMLTDKLSTAYLNSTQNYYCNEKYDAMLNKTTDPQAKMAYAMTVCLKNYKNGQNLDLQPLIDQVNNTEPKTTFSN